MLQHLDIFFIALQIVIYPLLLLFTISAFLYRFSICLSAFAISMALFIVENAVFILNAMTGVVKHEVAIEEISFASVSIVLSCIAVFMLTRAKRIYMESKKNV